MTHPIAAYIMAILNTLFMAFVYYNAKYNYIKINAYTILIGLFIIILARGSFAGIDYRTKKEKIVFYLLLLLNIVITGFVAWEWYRD